MGYGVWRYEMKAGAGTNFKWISATQNTEKDLSMDEYQQDVR